MPTIKPLRPDLNKYLKRHGLEKKFGKQLKLFQESPSHPSLNTELLEPKKLRIYSFRIDRKYRAIFIYRNGEVEVIDINLHYK